MEIFTMGVMKEPIKVHNKQKLRILETKRDCSKMVRDMYSGVITKIEYNAASDKGHNIIKLKDDHIIASLYPANILFYNEAIKEKIKIVGFELYWLMCKDVRLILTSENITKWKCYKLKDKPPIKLEFDLAYDKEHIDFIRENINKKESKIKLTVYTEK